MRLAPLAAVLSCGLSLAHAEGPFSDLSFEAATEAWERGHAMSRDEIARYALGAG